MKKSDKYLDGLLIRGLVDVRKLAGVANAKRLPNGEMGFCLMCLNNSTLNLYDQILSRKLGNFSTPLI